MVSFITMSDVKETGGIEDQRDLPFRAVKAGFTRFAENDVLFAKITPCMENGKGALARNLTNGIGCGSTEFHVLRAKEGGHSGFIYHVVQSKEFRQRAMMNMSGSAGQQRVPADFFAEHPVSIPSFASQKRISEILDALDSSLINTESLVSKYRQIKAGLMQDLFTRGVTHDGRLRPYREESPDFYKESPLGWIPKEWGIRDLGSLTEIVSGVTLGSKSEVVGAIPVPYLRVANVQDGFFDLSEVHTIHVTQQKLEKLQLRSGDVLMNEGGDFDKLGRGSVWREEIVPCIHQNHVFRVRPKSGLLDSDYLAFWSQSERGKKYFLLNSKQSTNLASINSTQLHRFPVAFPSFDEQERIVTRIRSVKNYIDELKLESQKLTQQKMGLMQDLLSSSVRVGQEV